MALTGRPDALPRVPCGALASCADGRRRARSRRSARARRRIRPRCSASARRCSASRARGRTSPGGACRLLRAADGWAALEPRARGRPARAARVARASRRPRGRRTGQLAEREIARAAARAGSPSARAGSGSRSRPPRPRRRARRAGCERAACGPRAEPPRRPPRVLDFSALWAGPLCAELLADAGARRDQDRERAAARRRARGTARLLRSAERAQAQRAARLHRARATRRCSRALLASADIVIESARPRALAQLGIDAEAFVAARAGRVWLSITGYGRGDAAPGRVAFGDDAAVAAGAAHAVADADGPLFCADAIADPLTGLHAALAALACWRAGGGALLDLSLCGVTAHALAFAPTGEFEVRRQRGRARVVVAGRARCARGRAARAPRCTARARAPAPTPRRCGASSRADPRRRGRRARAARRADRARADRGDRRRRSRASAASPCARRAAARCCRASTTTTCTCTRSRPRRRSIACGPPAVANARAARRGAAPRGRARDAAGCAASAYHESVAGPLDRDRLDAWVADRPLRVQHRSGALWVLNSAGSRDRAAGALAGAPSAIRAAHHGRLFRADAWLRERLRRRAARPRGGRRASSPRSASPGATDASADNDADRARPPLRRGRARRAAAAAARDGRAGPAGAAPSARVARGAVKALLDEPSLPDFAAFCARDPRRARGAAARSPCTASRARRGCSRRRRFATRARGAAIGIEHASVAPPELVALAAELGLAVVTQPHFLAERGDDYRRDVDARRPAVALPRARLARGRRPARRGQRRALRLARSVARDRGRRARAERRRRGARPRRGAHARAGARALRGAARRSRRSGARASRSAPTPTSACSTAPGATRASGSRATTCARPGARGELVVAARRRAE